MKQRRLGWSLSIIIYSNPDQPLNHGADITRQVDNSDVGKCINVHERRTFRSDLKKKKKQKRAKQRTRIKERIDTLESARTTGIIRQQKQSLWSLGDMGYSRTIYFVEACSFIFLSKLQFFRIFSKVVKLLISSFFNKLLTFIKVTNNVNNSHFNLQYS